MVGAAADQLSVTQAIKPSTLDMLRLPLPTFNPSCSFTATPTVLRGVMMSEPRDESSSQERSAYFSGLPFQSSERSTAEVSYSPFVSPT